MTFELLPVLDLMSNLYEKPRTIERFREYLHILQGESKGDLIIPIGGFNPMAKEHILQKLTELKTLHAEQVIQETLQEVNKKMLHDANTTIKIALNLSDDLKGSWTNRFTTDFDSKFKINALINRKFCVPVFWTSESYATDIIRNRTLQYVYRTVYWLSHPKPKKLKDYVEQEKFVAQNTTVDKTKTDLDFTSIDLFYKEHQYADDYNIIFNFFYGDEASASLSFPCYGATKEITGFEYAGL